MDSPAPPWHSIICAIQSLAYICILCIWNPCMCRWSRVPWAFRGRCISARAWYGFFPSVCYQRCYILFLYSCFCRFLCFTYKDIRSDWMISQLVACLAILRVNRVPLSESLTLFSMLSRHMLHNLIRLSLVLVKRFFIAVSPQFSLVAQNSACPGLTHRFLDSITACLFVFVFAFDMF